MNQAFLTGIVGIQANQLGLDILADNAANISTYGYRGQTPEFSTLFEKSMSKMGTAGSLHETIGYGSQLQAASMIQTQGTLIHTESETDLAIMGDGWFGVQARGETFFTRAGNFNFDANPNPAFDHENAFTNRLVTADGFLVMGKSANNFSFDPNYKYDEKETGSYVLTDAFSEFDPGTATDQGPLELPVLMVYPHERTTEVKFFGNLGLEDVPKKSYSTAIAPSGERNTIWLDFTQSATQPTEGVSWEITATVVSPDGETVYDTQTGTATFAANGSLVSSNLPELDNDGGPVSVNLGQGYSGIFSNGTPDTRIESTSNGMEAGQLHGYDINRNGQIIATFTNGRQSIMGQVGVFHFQNDQGLERIDGSRFRQSPNSGDPYFFENDNALVMTQRIENSNVRFDVALTELLIMQRALDANSKCISTGDQLIQKALEMDA